MTYNRYTLYSKDLPSSKTEVIKAAQLEILLKLDIETWGPKLARNVLHNDLSLKKGETVTIEAWTRALPWIDPFVIEARKMGVTPFVMYESENAFWANVDSGRAKVLGQLGAQEKAAIRKSDAYIYFWGPADRARWYRLPKSTLDSLTAYEDEWFKLAKENKLRWCRIELARVTEELAKDYRIGYREWTRELLEASTIDPQPMVKKGKLIAERFENGRRVLITHRNGTKFELGLSRRKCYVDDGVITEDDVEAGFGESTVPSGVVVVAVDESVAEGRYVSNLPTRLGLAQFKEQSDNGVWNFQNGRLTSYNYRKGKKSFDRMYAAAGEERDRPGILSIGLNPKIRMAPFFEDQEYGVVTCYIGANDWLGGTNKGEFKSWMALRGTDLQVDGEYILKAGKIVV